MSTLDDFRAANPAYAHIPDQALAAGLYNKFYKDKLTREDFDKKIQANPNQGTLPQKLDVDFSTIKTIESHGDPNAVSKKGALGVGQTMPKTLKDPGFGVKPAKDDSPQELERVGKDYWQAMKNEFKGDSRLAGMAYNWGVGHVHDWLASGADWRKVPKETQDYLSKMIKTHTEQKAAQ